MTNLTAQGPFVTVARFSATPTGREQDTMAKQRPQPRSKALARRAPPGLVTPASSSSSSGTPRRSTYFEAVAVYERGLDALQRHDYSGALALLDSVLTLYPDEKELHERVHLYRNICQRHVEDGEKKPRTIEERLYAATLAINGGKHDEAMMLLRLVRDEDPDNDHALYMLAVAHALRDELAEALVHLQRAVVLNPENRALARRDPDLEPLRGNETFRALCGPASLASSLSSSLSSSPGERRRTTRPKRAI